MPASFEFPSDGFQLWIPLDMNPGDVGNYWGNSYMPVLCRLRPGASLGGATSELHTLIARVRSVCPWEMPADWKADISVVSLRQALLGAVPMKVYILIAAAGIVLLLACANVANLELARAMKRHKEMALREAIGADRSQIVSQLLIESCLLGFGGGLLGLFLAWVSYSLFINLLPTATPGLASLRLSFRTEKCLRRGRQDQREVRADPFLPGEPI